MVGAAIIRGIEERIAVLTACDRMALEIIIETIFFLNDWQWS